MAANCTAVLSECHDTLRLLAFSEFYNRSLCFAQQRVVRELHVRGQSNGVFIHAFRERRCVQYSFSYVWYVVVSDSASRRRLASILLYLSFGARDSVADFTTQPKLMGDKGWGVSSSPARRPSRQVHPCFQRQTTKHELRGNT